MHVYFVRLGGMCRPCVEPLCIFVYICVCVCSLGRRKEKKQEKEVILFVTVKAERCKTEIIQPIEKIKITVNFKFSIFMKFFINSAFITSQVWGELESANRQIPQ